MVARVDVCASATDSHGSGVEVVEEHEEEERWE